MFKDEDRQSHVRDWIDSDFREPFTKPQNNILKEQTPILKDADIRSRAPIVHSNAGEQRYRDWRKNANEVKMSTFITGMSSAEEKKSVTSYCPKCDGQHHLDSCSAYMAMSVDERSNFLCKKKLCYACYGCISPNDVSKTCRKRLACKICSGFHPTGLHGWKLKKKDDSANEKSIVKNGCTMLNDSEAEPICADVVCLCVVPV